MKSHVIKSDKRRFRSDADFLLCSSRLSTCYVVIMDTITLMMMMVAFKRERERGKTTPKPTGACAVSFLSLFLFHTHTQEELEQAKESWDQTLERTDSKLRMLEGKRKIDYVRSP